MGPWETRSLTSEKGGGDSRVTGPTFRGPSPKRRRGRRVGQDEKEEKTKIYKSRPNLALEFEVSEAFRVEKKGKA